MAKVKRQWLETPTSKVAKRYQGQKAGKTLIAWLNHPQKTLYEASPKYNLDRLEELLTEAQFVCGHLGKYNSRDELKISQKHDKSLSGFWERYQKLNDSLHSFDHAPCIDADEFYDGNPVSWILSTKNQRLAFLAVPVRCILQLIRDRAILNIRKCQQCTKWYFARFSHQEYCSTSCRVKHLTGTEAFKEKRRIYMRKNYADHKSGKVK